MSLRHMKIIYILPVSFLIMMGAVNVSYAIYMYQEQCVHRYGGSCERVDIAIWGEQHSVYARDRSQCHICRRGG